MPKNRFSTQVNQSAEAKNQEDMNPRKNAGTPDTKVPRRTGNEQTTDRTTGCTGMRHRWNYLGRGRQLHWEDTRGRGRSETRGEASEWKTGNDKNKLSELMRCVNT